jgi:hypothetical protein
MIELLFVLALRGGAGGPLSLSKKYQVASARFAWGLCAGADSRHLRLGAHVGGRSGRFQ